MSTGNEGAKQTRIREILDGINEAVNGLGGTVSQLNERLSVVLTPVPPQAGAEGRPQDKKAESELIMELVVIGDCIVAESRRVAEIMSRLQI